MFLDSSYPNTASTFCAEGPSCQGISPTGVSNSFMSVTLVLEEPETPIVDRRWSEFASVVVGSVAPGEEGGTKLDTATSSGALHGTAGLEAEVVRGKTIDTVHPLPIPPENTLIDPLCRSTMPFVIIRPRPLPPPACR
jgi:hypothetical protein